MEYGWLVTAWEDVEAVLNDSRLQVRPASNRVPEPMRDTELGEIFSRLVRMNDGVRHDTLRRRVEAMIASYDLMQIADLATRYALAHDVADVAALTMAATVGISDPPRALPWIRDLAAAIPAGATDAAIERGLGAAEKLLRVLPGDSTDDTACNALGFLFQAHAATTAAITNALAGIEEAPVTLTRRYAAADTEIAGRRVREGDAIMVLLGPSRRYFGAGPHRCPGQHIAEAIVTATCQGRSAVQSGARVPAGHPALPTTTDR